MDIKEIIKDLLHAQKKKHKDLCQAIGISDAGMRKIYERNSCELDTLIKICDFFDVQITDLFQKEVIKQNVETHGDQSPAVMGDNSVIEYGESEDKEKLKSEIAVLKERVRGLEAELRAKNEIIDILKNK